MFTDETLQNLQKFISAYRELLREGNAFSMDDIRIKTGLTINQIRKLNSIVYFDFGHDPYTDYYFEQGDIDQFRATLTPDAFDFLMNHTMRSFK